MVTHEMPFNGNDIKELFINIITQEPNYERSNFNLFTPELKEFLKCLLEKDPDVRMSAKKALSCVWIKKFNKKEVKVSRSLL